MLGVATSLAGAAHASPDLDEDQWGPARRELRAMVREGTRRFPTRNHNDLVNVHAVWLSPALIRAEARAWATSLDRGPRAYAARVREHSRPGRLSFHLRFTNHRFSWVDASLPRVLRTMRLEVDGRFFPVESFERSYVPAMGEGATRVVHFRDLPGELALPGPSARRVRLWFPALPHRKGAGRRARSGRGEGAPMARIAFPPRMFRARWEHDLAKPPLEAAPPAALPVPDKGWLAPLTRTASPTGLP